MTDLNAAGANAPADPSLPKTLKLLLVNPNTSEATTDMMLRIARDAASPDVEIVGVTAAFGPTLITNERELEVAAEAVLQAISNVSADEHAGIIIAAFGDPAIERVRERLACIVTGIAGASMEEAGKNARRFSVATTTPDLVEAIHRCAERYGFGDQLVSVRVTSGEPRLTMDDPSSLAEALSDVIGRVVDEDGAEAVIIGGGPLSDAARSLSDSVDIPLIEPIPAAVRLVEARWRSAQ